MNAQQLAVMVDTAGAGDVVIRIGNTNVTVTGVGEKDGLVVIETDDDELRAAVKRLMAQKAEAAADAEAEAAFEDPDDSKNVADAAFGGTVKPKKTTPKPPPTKAQKNAKRKGK